MEKEDLMPEQVEVVIPNLKKNLSGVTATIVRLLPLQERTVKIAATGFDLPEHIPYLPLKSVLKLDRKKLRIWHARRNNEMLLGLVLRMILRMNFKLIFTSASQRLHTGYSRFLISKMDTVIATSEKSASYIDRPSTVITHGIDTNQFCPIEGKGELRLKLNLPNHFLVGCYGRIRKQKGTDVFVDAMIKLLPHHPNVTALVMGRSTSENSHFRKQIEHKVEKAGLQERILFLPEVGVEEMAERYQVLDLFVAPQRWEGFGLTPIEAMSCGVPVVATTVGTFPEQVKNGETGLLVSPSSVDLMHDAIKTLVSSSEDLNKCSRKARERVEEKFRIEGEVEAINAEYRKLLVESD